MMKILLFLIYLPLTILGQYSMAESATDISLPVTMKTFSVKLLDNNMIELHWITESEINNLGFEIYRKGDGENEFQMVSSYQINSSLKGAGNSNEEHEYSWRENNIYTHYVEYQLFSVDFSGEKHLNGMEKIQLNETKENNESVFLISAFPNPFNSLLKFNIESNQGSAVRVQVANINGQILQDLGYFELHSGNNEIKWNPENFPSNIYFILFLFKNSKMYVKKVVLLR